MFGQNIFVSCILFEQLYKKISWEAKQDGRKRVSLQQSIIDETIKRPLNERATLRTDNRVIFPSRKRYDDSYLSPPLQEPRGSGNYI